MRLVVPIVAALALVCAGAVAAWTSWPSDETAGPTPSVLATESTAAVPTPTPTPMPSRAKPRSRPTAAARAALDGCRAKVRAADAAATSAEVGMRDWAAHVKAQQDADAGKLTKVEMEAIWRRTRQAGPVDVKRYTNAVNAYRKENGSCAARLDAPAAISSALDACSQRADALKPVLAAGADGMGDWRGHLAAMQRSAAGKVHDPEGVWIKTYHAAPLGIGAYRKAVQEFDAPAC